MSLFTVITFFMREEQLKLLLHLQLSEVFIKGLVSVSSTNKK